MFDFYRQALLNEPIQEPPHQQPLLNRVNELSAAAVEWLLVFSGRFLQTLRFGLYSEFFSNLMLLFPTTVYMLHRISNLKRDEFGKFVVCSKCAKLYHLDECLKRKYGTILPKKCNNILFPLGKQSTVEVSLSIKLSSRMVLLSFIL